MADDELSKTSKEIDLIRLGSLLELALRTSSCCNDPYKDDVKIRMSDKSLYNLMENINNHSNSPIKPDTLFGWESLTLSYDVPWPLSMVICKDYCQTLYQIMFRHLFCCKFIERKLEATWRVHRTLHIKDYGVAYSLLRHKMLHFVHNLLFYITQIIEPSFQILITKFKEGKIDCVAEVVKLHKAFLTTLVDESMLTDNELLCHVTKLLLLCMDYSAVIDASIATKASGHREVFQVRITDIDQKFVAHLKLFVQALKTKNHVLVEIFENCA